MEKERRTKALLLSTLVVVVAALSIAFASLSRTLNINGIAKMDTASWSVYFANLSNPTTIRGAKQISAPSISDDKGTVQNINVSLSNPKDEISYTVDIVNDGTIDAEITMIKDIELTDAQKKIFEFKVTYTDTGDVLKDGDLLPAGKTKNITINIRFKDDITEADLPKESQTINLSYQITYTQYDGGNDLPIGPDSGGNVEIVGNPVLAPGTLSFGADAFFNGSLTRDKVESIDFLNSNIVPSEYTSTAWDASGAGDGSVMAWYTDSDLNGLNEVYIGGSGIVYAPESCAFMFMMFNNIKNINFNNNFDTSRVTDMNNMFTNSSLVNLDLSSFDTSNVTNMQGMFNTCSSLSVVNLRNWDTSNVTNMQSMFQQCGLLENLNLSHFNTSNVTNMSYMFNSCLTLASVDVSNFNTEKVTTMSYMFGSYSGSINTTLTDLDLSSFVITSVTDMSYMFGGMTALANLDFRNADFSNVNSYAYMFGVGNMLSNPRVIVKDETQKTWLTSKFTNLPNVVLPSEL